MCAQHEFIPVAEMLANYPTLWIGCNRKIYKVRLARGVLLAFFSKMISQEMAFIELNIAGLVNVKITDAAPETGYCAAPEVTP